MNIEIISSSHRKESITHRVALFLRQYLSDNSSHQVDIIDVREWDIPFLVDGVYRSEDDAPDHLKPLARRMFAANAFIFLSPEYNGGYSASLKNLMDHFPKQGHKAIGIVTASNGPMGGLRASQQLQLFVNGLFGVGSPYMLIVPGVDKKFSAEGKLVDEVFSANVHTFVTEFLWLAEAVFSRTLGVVNV